MRGDSFGKCTTQTRTINDHTTSEQQQKKQQQHTNAKQITTTTDGNPTAKQAAASWFSAHTRKVMELLNSLGMDMICV